MSDVTAILFCGGRGTRLYPVTDYYQKVMMPLGSSGHPMLEYVINWLSSQGITKFIALIRYRANQIRRYFGDGSDWGVEIEYILDDPNFKGTGGALVNARKHIKTKNMLIYFTDILSNFDVNEMINYHKSHKKIGTTMLDRNWKVNEGIVESDNNHLVEEITNRPKQEIFANTGISLFSDRVFEYLDLLANEEKGNNIDLSGDIFPILAEEDQMAAYFSDDWWLDIGSLRRHQMVDSKLLQEKFGGSY